MDRVTGLLWFKNLSQFSAFTEAAVLPLYGYLPIGINMYYTLISQLGYFIYLIQAKELQIPSLLLSTLLLMTNTEKYA